MKTIYWIENENGRIVTEPYWEKYMAINHITETEFPSSWKSLYKKGYRVKQLTIIME